MSALAIFTSLPNSHPFQERHVSLHEPVKIGRSVARARPAPNNAIFDCKVLSRNHALLWYENGKFYLQDTKSSNGTFINNKRLSKGSEESPAQEIYSGDIVQFGVDVMENSRKVTHGCIIASIQLFYPDGREASADHSNPFLNSAQGAGLQIQSQEVYQLAQYLQEALHREQMLQGKIAALQRLIQNTQEASESGWQALIDEDRLLSRLEVLENQLQAYSKNQTEDTLRQELVALQEDKYNYETTSKESLRRVLQEKLDAVRKLSDLERSLSNTEDECAHLKQMCEASQNELQQLAEKHQEQLQEMAQLQEKLQEAEKKHKEELEKEEKEKAELQAKLDEMIKQESLLSAKVESLQADNDFTKEQLANMKARMEALKEKGGEIARISDVESQGVQVDIEIIEKALNDGDGHEQLQVCPEADLTLPATGPEKLKETHEQIEYYKAQLKESEARVQESKEQVEKLQNQLEQATIETVTHLAKITSLEEQIKLSDLHLNQMVENAAADLNIQLHESRKQADNSTDLVKGLKDHILELETELRVLRQSSGVANVANHHSHDVTNSNSIHNHVDTHAGSVTFREELEKLKELLAEAREAQKKSEIEVDRCKGELDDASKNAKKSAEESKTLKMQLFDAQRQAKDRSDHVVNLQDQLNKAESTTKEVKQQILVLREQLEEEKEAHNSSSGQLDGIHKQLLEAQQAAKQSHNEAEQLRMKVKALQEELEKERADKQRADTRTHNAHSEMQKQAARNEDTETQDSNRLDDTCDSDKKVLVHAAEFAALKEECAHLRQRIQDIESEMKKSRWENHQLQSDYSKLQDSYTELEELKDRLQTQESMWQINLTDAEKHNDSTKQELTEANNEISRLKDQCSQYREEITRLNQELNDVAEEFSQLAYRSKTLSTCAMIPLLMLLFGILLAMYPTLAEITATSTLS